MTLPRFPGKVGDRDTLIYAKNQPTPPSDPPQRMILCYQNQLFDRLTPWWRRQRRMYKISGLYGSAFFLPGTGNKVGVIGRFGIGGPVTAVILERLAAWGVEEVIIVGLAGGLQHELNAGHTVLVSEAIRDEGTSYHYLPAEYIARPHPGLLGSLEANIKQKGLPYDIGATWTTDAPYRETWAEWDKYSKAGILTVEMEMATLFIVAEALDLAAAGMLVISDRVTFNGWSDQYDQKLVNQRLVEAAHTASQLDLIFII